jgi:hypothetical protein
MAAALTKPRGRATVAMIEAMNDGNALRSLGKEVLARFRPEGNWLIGAV